MDDVDVIIVIFWLNIEDEILTPSVLMIRCLSFIAQVDVICFIPCTDLAVYTFCTILCHIF